MSGICGMVSFDGSPARQSALEAMANAAAHRGPDGIRYHTQKGVGLAHLALDITPEDFREKQPLVEERAGLALVADARVDNRAQLIGSLGLSRQEPTDAQLILAAYKRWGVECAPRLIGDFAFALWDEKKRRLFAARDAMGMRAFYYRGEGGRFVFGTEVKQVLAAPGVEARLFEPAVAAYLVGCFGPLEWSFYEGISQLAPAHALVADDRGLRTWRYWDIDPQSSIEYSSEQEYVEHFGEVFEESVRCRLRGIKPTGLFLSGGVDSGSIASVAGRLMERGVVSADRFRAYSWAFEELAQCDERHISSEIADHYGFGVSEVSADEAWPLKGYPEHGPDLDEPYFGVYQALIEHTLSAARSEGMGLVFSGDRGDLMVGDIVFDNPGLLLAGRFRELGVDLRERSRRAGAPLSRVTRRHLVEPLLLTLWPQGKAQWLRERVRWMFGRTQPRDSYPGWLRPEFAERVGLDEIVRYNGKSHPTMNNFARRTRYEMIFIFMQMRGMVWSERTWARYGLGFADPWSDRRLAEFVLATPQYMIQRPSEPKRIARQAMRGLMPEKARRNFKRIVPYPLYERALREWSRGTVEELLKDTRSAARGYLDEEALRNHYHGLCRGEPEHDCLWWALSLEMWLRQYWS